MAASKTVRAGSSPAAPANMKKKSNDASVESRVPGVAPESFRKMMELVDRVCRAHDKRDKKKITAP